MRGEIAKLCLVIATLALGSVSSDGVCDRGRTWWHRQRGACIPCTRCDPRRLVVKYPCELHRDTICQPLYEVRIWPFNTEKDNDASDTSSDYEYYEDTDNSGEVSDDIEWNIQTSTLTLAVSGCIVFFVVVVTLSLYHAKQWRVLKQKLKSDVQDLSAKLRLMETGGDAPSEPVPSDHHIYCNIHVGKDALLDSGINNIPMPPATYMRKKDQQPPPTFKTLISPHHSTSENQVKSSHSTYKSMSSFNNTDENNTDNDSVGIPPASLSQDPDSFWKDGGQSPRLNNDSNSIENLQDSLNVSPCAIPQIRSIKKSNIPLRIIRDHSRQSNIKQPSPPLIQPLAELKDDDQISLTGSDTHGHGCCRTVTTKELGNVYTQEKHSP